MDRHQDLYGYCSGQEGDQRCLSRKGWLSHRAAPAGGLPQGAGGREDRSVKEAGGTVGRSGDAGAHSRQYSRRQDALPCTLL